MFAADVWARDRDGDQAGLGAGVGAGVSPQDGERVPGGDTEGCRGGGGWAQGRGGGRVSKLDEIPAVAGACAVSIVADELAQSTWTPLKFAPAESKSKDSKGSKPLSSGKAQW